MAWARRYQAHQRALGNPSRFRMMIRDRPEPGGDYAAQRNGCWCQPSATACSRWRGPAAHPTGGLWIDLLVLDREGRMKWRVMIELAGAEGTVQLHEVSTGGSTTAEC
jgi:hypothetical protein